MEPCAKCGVKLDWGEGQSSNITRVTSIMLCHPCYQEKCRVNTLVGMHRQRAKKKGLPYTLTVEEWASIEAHFQYHCAYCLVHMATCLEHFIPIGHGGGTTKDNVIPACERCNTYKHKRHPDSVTNLPDGAIERVRNYLTSLQ